MRCYGIGTITRSFNSHLRWCQGSSSVDRDRPFIITDSILCFRSFWRNIRALWSFICCSTSGFPSSMHLNMTSLPANTGLYSKSVTVEKLVRKVWVIGTAVTPLCSSQSRLHVSLFPLREEAAGDVVRASLLSRNDAVTQHLQGGTLRSCSASGLCLFPFTWAQTAVSLQNCSYYWGFAAWMAYYINHPLYTPPSEYKNTHTHKHMSWVNCSSYLTLSVSCCSIRGATDQTWPHRVLGIHFSVAMI